MSSIEPVKSPQEQFEETIKARLRDDIGSLLPDDVLKELVQKGVEELFFKEKVTTDKWNNTFTKQPFFKEELGKIIKEQIEKETKLYIKDNKEKIANSVAEYMKQNAGSLISACISTLLSDNIYQISNVMRNDLANQISRGL